MDKIIAVLRANQDKAPDELVNDFQNLPVNPQTNEYDRDASAAFIKKWAPYIQENFENWEEIDYSANEPLKNRMAKDGVNPDLIGNANYLAGLARKYGSTPAEVSKAFAEISKEKAAADEKQKIADEYKREAEARYARQKAVDNYEHQYKLKDLIPFAGPFLPEFGPNAPGWLSWLMNRGGDIVISDDTKKAVIDDPNNTAAILANAGVDVVGTGADFLPGAGALLGTGVRTARDIANDKEWSDIVRERGVDAAIAGGPALIGKLKGVKPDVDAVENASTVIGNLAPEAKTASDAIKKGKEYDKLFEVNAKKTGLNAMSDDVMRETFANMSKEDFALYKAQLKKKNPKMYEVVKDVKYENRADGVLDAYNKKAAEGASFADNELMQAELYKKQNPKKYAAYKVAEGVQNKVAGPATKISLHEAGEQKKPHYTKDAISYIIDKTSKQWEAGFVPTPDQGIVYEAYKKWESER